MRVPHASARCYRRWCTVLVAQSALLVALFGCGTPSPSEPSVSTNSNWLTLCVDSDECSGQSSCQCGACTTSCDDQSACAMLADARCASRTDPAVWAQCESREPQLSAGVCLPRCSAGDCAQDQACVEGACVFATLPDVALCADVSDRDAADRAREDELLALVQALRVSGGVSCGGGAPSVPSPPLRLDPRLLCSARVLAVDLAQTQARSLTDSLGRSSTDRFAAVGYVQNAWGESFALMADTPARALDIMLADVGSCVPLTDAALEDVGVGSAGGTIVLSLGRE